MLTVVGCGGSESKPDNKDAGFDGGVPVTAKPNLAATPANVVLAADVGKTSTAADVKVTNNGTAAGVLTVIPSGVGIAATGCTGSLAVGASCTVSISASPSTAGAIVGSVSVSVANGNTISIGVSGTATLPGNFTLSPTAIALGDVAVGAVVQASVTVTANAALTGLTTGVQGANLKADASSTCTSTLAAGASCVVVVNFSSATAGSSISDAIVVGQGGVTKSVPVTANVLAPAKLAATPTLGSLVAVPGSVSETNLEVNVGNIGGLPTGSLTVLISGTNATSFKVLSENCTITTLAASRFCTVTVQFAPAATVTAQQSATLTITDKGPGASVSTVALTGIPKMPSNLTIAGATTALGSVAPGSSGAEIVFTVTNITATPSGALTALVAPAANITISSNTCATKATLAQGETCTVGLKLTPAASATPQAVVATLSVSGVAATAPAIVVVTGAVVTGAMLTATPSSVSFGSIPVNQVSTPQTVTITNKGATATGVLGVTLTGTGAAQVAQTSTCTGTLAPAATCTVTVTFSPTDTTGVSGSITVTDGVSSVSASMSGTGLAPTPLTVTPTSLDFGARVIGYSQATVTTITVKGQTLTVGLVAGTTTDSGAITTVMEGAHPTDFAVSAADSNCTSIQPGQTCTLSVVFTPTALGDRTATLTVKGAKGGLYNIVLKGKVLPLVELQPLTDTHPTTGLDITGLDFGQKPNGTRGNVFKYRAIVRGATNPAATTTTANIVLTTGTTPDFRNMRLVGDGYVDTDKNPCDGAVLALTANTGEAGSAGTAPWSAGVITDDVTQKVWSCDFYVQFYPQTGKSATPKTATISAIATAGGEASLPLTGTATGPLTITPDKYAFESVLAPGGSTQGNTTLTGTVTLTIDSTGDETVTFTVRNEGIAVAQGPLSVVLGGANAGDFGILIDNGCSGASLNAGIACEITVAFAPTSVGAKTATLTVTAAGSGESAVATITAAGAQPLSLGLTPATLAFPSVAQANVGAWQTFTIANPVGADLSGKLDYTISGDDADDFAIYKLTDGAYPATACGDSNTKQLAAGASCTVQVRFSPSNTKVYSSTTPREAKLDVTAGGVPVGSSDLSGIASAQITLAGAAIAVVDGVQTVDFGKAAIGRSSTKSVTITNNGAATSGGAAVLAYTLPAHYSVASTSPAACNSGQTLAGQASCELSITFTGYSPAAPPETSAFPIQNGSLATTSTTPALNLKAQTVAPAALALSGFNDVSDATLHQIDLGAVALGGNTGVLTLWFTNTGGVDATVLESNIVETPPGTEFSVVAENKGTCLSGAALVPAGRCSVNVQFKPTTTGDNKTADFSLLAAGVAPVTVKLTARAIALASSVYAKVKGTANSFYAFPGSTADLASVPTSVGKKVYFELFNNTTAPITVNLTTLTLLAGVGRPGDFAIALETDATGLACTASLGVAEFCTFSVKFLPEIWEESEYLYRWATVAYNGVQIGAVLGQVQKPAKLQLSAVSSATVKVTGTSVDFGQVLAQQPSSLVFTITNTGEAATAGAVTAKLEGGALAFATSTTTCGAGVLAAGATCTATVTVRAPLGSYRAAGATVMADGTVNSEDSTTLEKFSLLVDVVDPAALSLSTVGSVTTFTDVAAGVDGGTLAINVLNGQTSDTVNTRQTSGVLAITQTNATDFTILPSSGCYGTATGGANMSVTGGSAGSCNITVQFTPASAGAKTTTISVSATPGGTVQTITLTGNGLSALSINLNGAGPGTSAAPIALGAGSFVIQNIGGETTGLLRTTIGGANASLFAITYDSCFGQRVVSGGICTVTVEPNATPSTTTVQNGTLTVTDGAPSTINNVTSYFKAGGPST